MRLLLALSAILLTGGCASDAAKTREKHPVFKAYKSSNSAKEVAMCLQRTLPGVTSEIGNNEIVVSVKNQFGTSLISWFVADSPTGSTIEVRRAQKIAGGINKAEACF